MKGMPDKCTRSANIKGLNDVIGKQKAYLDRIASWRVSCTQDMPHSACLGEINQVDSWLERLSCFIRNSYSPFVEDSVYLLNYVLSKDDCLVKLNSYVKHIECSYLQSKEITREREKFKRLVHYKTGIASKVDSLVVQNLKIEIVAATAGYDMQVGYAAPSTFDDVIAAYISTQELLRSMIVPMAEIVANGSLASFLSTIGTFNIALLDRLNVSCSTAKMLTYTSVVRIVFDAAYVVDEKALCGDHDENERFLAACEKFSRQSVKQLCLSDSIAKGYTAGLPIASMFNAKHVNLLRSVEYMTNPIDIAFQVHNSLTTLAKVFGGCETCLSCDDMMTLLLALMSNGPPINAIPVAKFLRKWEGIQVSALARASQSYFIAAVEQIQRFGATQPAAAL